MSRFAAAFAGLAALALPLGATADEVWSSQYGDVVYEADIGDVAVLSYPLGDGARGHVYFPGLGGNFDRRGMHEGYWIEPREGECSGTMTGPDGVSSQAWGRALIVFDGPAFPTPWTGLAGDCFGELEYSIRAEPIIAQ